MKLAICFPYRSIPIPCRRKNDFHLPFFATVNETMNYIQTQFQNMPVCSDNVTQTKRSESGVFLRPELSVKMVFKHQGRAQV